MTKAQSTFPQAFRLPFLLLFPGSAWLNGLKLGVFGLQSNPLLLPALLAGLGFAAEWLVITFKAMERERRPLLLPALAGMVPLGAGDSMLLRLPRLIYTVFLISSVSSLVHGYPITTDFLLRLYLFFLLMIVLPTHPVLRRPSLIRLLLRLTAVLTALSGFFAFFCLLFNAKFTIRDTVIGVWGKGVAGLYLNANQAAILSALGLFAALYLLRREQRRAVRIAAAVAVAVQTVVLVFSNSRTTLLSLLAATFIYLFMHALKRRKLDVFLLSLSLIVLVLFAAVRPYVEKHHLTGTLDFEQYKTKDAKEEWRKLSQKKTAAAAQRKDKLPLFYFHAPIPQTEVRLKEPTLRIADRLLSGRLQLAKEASLLWRSKPVSGYGFRHLYEAYAREVSPHGNLEYGALSSSHNLFLDLLWMGGAVGFGLGLAFVVLLLRALFRLRFRREEQSLAVSLYALCFIFLILTQMLEVTVITAFNLNTLCFWALLPGLACYAEACTQSGRARSFKAESRADA